MCMIDYGERAAVWDQIIRKARKSHLCCECHRTIEKGEKYEYISSLFDGSWDHYHLCAHCSSASRWLSKHCGGYLIGGILDDLQEHWEENYRKDHLGRLIVGMARKWKNFNKNNPGLMKTIEIG